MNSAFFNNLKILPLSVYISAVFVMW